MRFRSAASGSRPRAGQLIFAQVFDLGRSGNDGRNGGMRYGVLQQQLRPTVRLNLLLPSPAVVCPLPWYARCRADPLTER